MKKKFEFVWKLLVVLALVTVPLMYSTMLHISKTTSGKTFITINAVDATSGADYTYTNPNADTAFALALNALPATGGTLNVLSTGTIQFASPITVTKANVVINCSGVGTAFTAGGVSAPFIASANGLTFENCSFDVSPNMGATTGWLWINVAIGTTLYTERSPNSSLVDNALNAPTGRTGYVIAASDAPANVKAQADVVCDGTADNVEIQAYINALSAGRTIQEEVLCVGTFNIAAPIALPSYTILEIQGEIGYSGSVNDAVIVIDSAAVMAEIDGGIIRGGGKGNANANGVELTIPNGGGIFGTTFYDCRNAIDVTGAWQFAIDHVDIHGQGADQNYIGIYTHVPAGNDTALIVSNTSVKDTSSDGIRLEHISGSKWTNIEVGAAGGHGWNIGTPTSPKLVQFAHITNCLSDSNIGDAWHIDGNGSGDVAKDIQFSNIWAGNSARAVYINDGGNITFSNVMFATFTQHAVYVDTGCFRIDFDGGYVDGWGTSAANTYSAFYLDTLAKSFVKNINMTAANSHSSIREVNACNYNQFIGNEIGDAGTIIKVGASTIVSGNRGFIAKGEIRTISGTLAGVTPAGIMLSVDNPFGQAVRVLSVDIEVTTQGAASGSMCVGVGSSATSDYPTMFSVLPCDNGTSYPYFFNSLKTATYGVQTNPINWATGAGNRYLNFYAHVANAAYVATYTITVMGN